MSTTKHSNGAALQQALEERNRLWEEVQRLRAEDRELDYWRGRALEMEASLGWRVTALLRRLRRDPVGFAKAVARRLRRDFTA